VTRDAKRAAIFDAVLNLAEEYAEFPRFTISDVARKAGIGKSTIYEYFSNKDEMIAATRRYCGELLLAAIDGALSAPGGFQVKMLRLLTEARASMLPRVRSLIRVFSHLLPDELDVESERLCQMGFSQLIELGVQEGVIDAGACEPEISAALITAFVIMHMAARRIPQIPAADVDALAYRQFVRQLAPVRRF
jgi:AcrR family transcriptional regulator